MSSHKNQICRIGLRRMRNSANILLDQIVFKYRLVPFKLRNIQTSVNNLLSCL